MREACIECVLKHVGQATALMHETVKGYEYHFVYVVGHLAEAEDEAATYPIIRDMIYNLRQSYMRGEDVDIDALVNEVFDLWRSMQ
jgi:hypothetical protein